MAMHFHFRFLAIDFHQRRSIVHFRKASPFSSIEPIDEKVIEIGKLCRSRRIGRSYVILWFRAVSSTCNRFSSGLVANLYVHVLYLPIQRFNDHKNRFTMFHLYRDCVIFGRSFAFERIFYRCFIIQSFL